MDGTTISLRHDLISLPGGAQENTALYDLDGRRVDDTNIVVTPPDHPIFAKEYARAPERIEVPHDLDVIDEEVLYIGVARNHYGHFLLDSMSRMWAAIESEMTCVFLGAGDVQGEYYDRIMDCLKLRLLSPTRPTLYRNIWVPSPTLTNNEITPNADSAHLKVTEQLHTGSSGEWDQPVFLSRLGFRSRARTAAMDKDAEETLERRLAASGYRVVRPETLPFAQQIALFNECPTIVGLLGSAFHTAIFSRKKYAGRLALLTFRPERKKGRYGLIDSIKGYSASYIECCTLDKVNSFISIDVDKAIEGLASRGFLPDSNQDHGISTIHSGA